MDASRTQRPLDWSHIGLLTALLIGVVSYGIQVYSASSLIENWILVLPVAVVTVGLLVTLLVRAFLHGRDLPVEMNEGFIEDDETPPWHTAAYFGLFGLYVLLLEPAGFDVATALFLLATLLLKGERRPLVLVIFPLAFAVLCTWAFKYAIPYPVPTWLPYP